ncbi:Lysophospholipase, alpha-beta hydrolase superfamily [Vogesella sp. LIG4]|nr:Lysophospholipase, alpha-beta hydrolase superfamily [Vogesella sp. LIG4]
MAAGAAHGAPPLLFVHGAYSAANCWQQHFLPWFAAQGYDCWALSLRGHGNSPGREQLHDFGISDYVADVAWACGQLVQPPVLIGHSMGGYVLQQYLRERTAPAAILLASVPPGGMALSTWRLSLTAPDILLGLNLFQLGRYTPSAAEVRRMLLSPDTDLASAQWLADNCQVESRHAILDMNLSLALFTRPLSCPALSIVGRNDLLVSPLEARSGGQLLGLDTEVLPDLGHMLMLDTGWRRVAETMDGWLRRQFPSAGPPAQPLVDHDKVC